MAKQCNHPGCNNPIFSHKYCSRHQRDRTDDKWIQSQQKKKDKLTERMKYSKLTYRQLTKTVNSVLRPKEASGEKELFESIWNTSDKRSWLTGTDLRQYGSSATYSDLIVQRTRQSKHPLWFNLFHHPLNKKNYPRYRLNKKNVILLSPQEHLDIHSMGREKLEQKYGKEVMDRYFDLWVTLKEEYNGNNT